MSAEPQALPIIADEASRIIALLDAFAASPVPSSMMLHDREDCIVAYAVRLWCGARRLSVHEVTRRNEHGEREVLTAEFGEWWIAVFGPLRPFSIEPVPGVVVSWRPSDDDVRLSMIEVE